TVRTSTRTAGPRTTREVAWARSARSPGRASAHERFEPGFRADRVEVCVLPRSSLGPLVVHERRCQRLSRAWITEPCIRAREVVPREARCGIDARGFGEEFRGAGKLALLVAREAGVVVRVGGELVDGHEGHGEVVHVLGCKGVPH